MDRGWGPKIYGASGLRRVQKLRRRALDVLFKSVNLLLLLLDYLLLLLHSLDERGDKVVGAAKSDYGAATLPQ